MQHTKRIGGKTFTRVAHNLTKAEAKEKAAGFKRRGSEYGSKARVIKEQGKYSVYIGV